ncbi:hypothetical protein J7E55_13110 [Bacillus sp. ISL-53]|nr:hypothetical protein [Bacillus sp. ISL-53]
MQKQKAPKGKIIKLVIFIGIATLITFIGFPIFVNFLMFANVPEFIKFLAPYGISGNAVWIGFFATFFGALIGGVISGLFTYLGVRKTILFQERKDKDEFREKYRAMLEIHDIQNGGYLLKNLKERRGRLVLTKQYEHVIQEQLHNGSFNYLEIRNSGPGKALNCSVKATITYEESQENFNIEVFIPVIYEEEKIYILVDRLIDENGNELDESDLYRLTKVLVTYETSAKENIKIERVLIGEPGNIQTKDSYSVKRFDESEFDSLFELDGTDDTWYFLKDLD